MEIWDVLGVVRFLLLPFVVLFLLATYAHHQGDPRKPFNGAREDLGLFLMGGLTFFVVSIVTNLLLGGVFSGLPNGNAWLFAVNAGLLYLIGLAGSSKKKAGEFLLSAVVCIAYYIWGYPWIIARLGWSRGSWGF